MYLMKWSTSSPKGVQIFRLLQAVPEVATARPAGAVRPIRLGTDGNGGMEVVVFLFVFFGWGLGMKGFSQHTQSLRGFYPTQTFRDFSGSQ